MSKRRTPQDKARIVLEFLNTGTSAAELCRKHSVSPVTFQDWKDKFMEGGKQTLVGRYFRSADELKHTITTIVE